MNQKHRTTNPLLLVAVLLAWGATVAADDRANDAASPLPPGPDFKEVLSLEGVGGPRISPDGSAIVYAVSSTDWENNRYDSEIWLARSGSDPFQLTRTKDESSGNARWSPDGKWVAFVADRGDDTQIWLINPAGGEARALTGVEDGVSGFEWSPDGRQMAVTITDPLSKERERVEKTYGEFAVEDAEFRMTHLWVLDVALTLDGDEPAKLPKEQGEDDDDEDEDGADEDEDEDEESPSAFRRLTEGDAFTVNTFRWSPDGSRIAFDHTPDSRVESFSNSDISIVDVSSGEVRKLIDTPGPDDDPYWSPDGKWILFETADGETAYYLNEELAKVPSDGGDRVILTEGFDEDPGAVAWLADGIRFVAMDKTHRKLYRLDPQGGGPEVVIDDPRFVWSVSFSKDGKIVAYSGEGGDSMTEVYRQERGASKPVRITKMTEQTTDWSVGSREIVRWKSKDGVAIEGVLLKPDEFDPAKKHPLLVIIHGGPAWLSYPTRVYRYVYPVQQWLAKGAVILMPNYRGSTGYGEAFRSLNVRNLGVGDAWDVMSGVDHLIEQGFVDPERMGAMGWSQGGYISAFLTTTTDRFRAISVGAGISNWMTYYVNTDIHPFTRHYLKGTPWSDPEVYAKTSPMTYINDARTPTLIQHGEFDRRVPTPNAYELFQGLQDVGVTTELVIYKGFGHGISKPKERLAAVWHNWQWFARHVWGEEVEIP